MIKKKYEMKEKVKSNAISIAKDESGMELLQMLIVALIAVILGGIALKFWGSSYTEIGELLVDKIKSTFSL